MKTDIDLVDAFRRALNLSTYKNFKLDEHLVFHIDNNSYFELETKQDFTGDKNYILRFNTLEKDIDFKIKEELSKLFELKKIESFELRDIEILKKNYLIV